MDRVRRFEIHQRVAVGVGAAGVVQVNLFGVEVKRHLPVVGLHWRGSLRIGRLGHLQVHLRAAELILRIGDFRGVLRGARRRKRLFGFGHGAGRVLAGALIAAHDVLARVLVRNDRGDFREHRIAAGMVAMMVRVHDPADRLARDLLHLVHDRLRHRNGLAVAPVEVVIGVDQKHALVGDAHAHVPADIARVGAGRHDHVEMIVELLGGEQIRRHRHDALRRLRAGRFPRQHAEHERRQHDPHRAERVAHSFLLG